MTEDYLLYTVPYVKKLLVHDLLQQLVSFIGIGKPCRRGLYQIVIIAA